MLTVSDLTRRYRVTRATVISWIEGEGLPAIDVSPANAKYRHYRIKEDDLSEFMDSRGSTSVEPPPTAEYLK